MGNTWTQFFPPAPSFTEKHIPDLSGKVYIITGSNTGIGKELAEILYAANAKVYIAARSVEKARAAISSLEAAHPSSKGILVFLKLDLADLVTIKAAVREFLSKEDKLHVLFNNASVMSLAEGMDRTAQGYELNIGVNNVGTFLLTQLLTPVLIQTARTEPANTVRVVWVSSTIDLAAPKDLSGALANLDFHVKVNGMLRYGLSKTLTYFHAVEYAKRHKDDNVISLAVNPGNLNSELYREHTGLMALLLRLLTHPVHLGGYSLLFAGLSPEVTLERTGSFAWPWGRFGDVRKDVVDAAKKETEGGKGLATKFWTWTEDQVERYV